jgi:hypothetical protein
MKISCCSFSNLILQLFQMLSLSLQAWFTRAASARLRSRAMLHFQVVWLDWAAKVEKNQSCQMTISSLLF